MSAILHRMGEGLNRWLSSTRQLIERARRGELPWTPVDPHEVLGTCRHCSKQATRSDGIAFAPDHVVHVECKIAFDADKPRLIGIYSRWMDALEPVRLHEDLAVRRQATEALREMPREFTLADLRLALDKMAKASGPNMAINRARVVLGDTQATAN